MRTAKEVDYAFSPVTNLDPGQKQRIYKIEVLFKDTASEVLDLVPENADRIAALRKLLEVKQGCTQAISHEQTVTQTKKEEQNGNKKEGK